MLNETIFWTLDCMDAAESLAAEFLRLQGFATVEYEPDGNVPPDFLCDGQVAVEVRRLNQHHQSDGRHPEALDTKGVAIWDHVQRVLIKLGPPTSGRSWWVSYSFKRPISDFRRLPLLLERTLEDFRNSPLDDTQIIPLVDGFKLTLTPAEISHDLQFVLATASDRDSSGWLLDMMQMNLQLCIDEKWAKTANARAKYGPWWLVLVDMVGWGLSELDQQMFDDAVQIDRRGWDKIVLIDPRDPSRFFEV